MDFLLFAATPAPWNYLLGWTLSLLALFLCLLVLVQRGRGGGLAGALGGMGGQSAFGTKAGDLFTRVTIGVAAVWILLCMLSIKVLNPTAGKPVFDRTEITLPADPTLKVKPDKTSPRKTDGKLPAESEDADAKAPASDTKSDAAPAQDEAPAKAPPADKAAPQEDAKASDQPAEAPAGKEKEKDSE
jgi:preprotein translocase subunit SecG